MNSKNFFEKSLPFKNSEQKLTSEKLKEKLQDPFYLPTRDEIFRVFKSFKEWSIFCNNPEHPIFEALNQEYLDALNNYFLQQAENFNATKNKPLVILEVGAGDGHLAYFLQEKIKEQKSNKIKILATNLYTKEWKIKSVFPVENISQKKAI
jgi:hypothetical protein